MQVQELFFVHLNMLNAGTKGVNAAISSRKHISATAAGGGSERCEDGCIG